MAIDNASVAIDDQIRELTVESGITDLNVQRQSLKDKDATLERRELPAQMIGNEMAVFTVRDDVIDSKGVRKPTGIGIHIQVLNGMRNDTKQTVFHVLDWNEGEEIKAVRIHSLVEGVNVISVQRENAKEFEEVTREECETSTDPTILELEKGLQDAHALISKEPCPGLPATHSSFTTLALYNHISTWINERETQALLEKYDEKE